MIELVETIQDVRAAVSAARAGGRAVGLVPTMGALHEGHGRLLEVAQQEAGFVVASIFVNPLQFGPNEDFSRYPRSLPDDRARCEAAGVDLIFNPNTDTMYPRGRNASTFVEVPGLSDVLEGASRPGHFRGVATVVLKLFEIVQPDIAFFGAKDYQQQVLIRRMVSDLDVPVTIRAVETVRESDGLAMSSRNRYLDRDQRRAATVLHRALERARLAVGEGEVDANRVRQLLKETVQSEPMANLDYAEVADALTLEPLTAISPGGPSRALVAARFGATRLIDNSALIA